MTFYFFDLNDVLQFVRTDALEAHYIQEELKHTATFPYDSEKIILPSMRVGWLDEDGNLRLFEITQPTSTQPEAVQSYEAEHVALIELTQSIVQDIRPYNVSASTALNSILSGTSWSVGNVAVNPTASSNFYWISAWESIVEASAIWNVRFVPRLTFSGTEITGRFIDILSSAGTFRGVRLTLDRNVETVGVTYDERDLVTALYGRGNGEIVGSTADNAPTYGRKIMFGDVVWSTTAGNPANKPAGQLYVEDVQATAIWGRKGQPRFGVVEFDTDDPNELLTLTWQELQTRINPKITIDMDIVDLERYGYAKEGMALNDLVNVIIEPLGLEIQAKVIQYDEDLLLGENSRPVIGDYRANIIYKDVQTSNKADIGQQIAEAAPSLTQGFIDTAVIGIMSSKTDRQTLPDGSEIYVTADGTKAVRFAGAGILLADSKTSSGDWDWSTAITGAGIVADMITSGVMNANLVTVVSSDGNSAVQFTGTGILIANSKDASGNWIWSTAINGNGINASAVNSGSINADLITTGSINANLIKTGSINADLITSGTLNASLLKIGKIDANQVVTAGTGMTLNGTSIIIMHPSLGENSYTVINVNGMQMVVNGKIAGGLYRDPAGNIVSAANMLFNPNQQKFYATVGASTGIGESGAGIDLNFLGQAVGHIGGFTYDGSTPVGAAVSAFGTMAVLGNNVLNMASNGITIDAGEGDITFSFTGVDFAGTRRKLTFTAQQVWNAIAQSIS